MTGGRRVSRRAVRGARAWGASLACLLALAVPAPAAADVAAFLAEVGAAQSRVTAFRARFEQEKRLEIVRDVLRSSGTILVSRDRGVVWSVESPERSRLALLESGVFVDGRRLEGIPGGDAPLPLGRIGALFGGLSPAILDDFEAERLEDGGLRLRPRREPLASMVREVTLTLAGEHRLPAAIRLEETAGGTTVVRLEGFEIDPPLSEGAFAP